jgi:hypothetical protein
VPGKDYFTMRKFSIILGCILILALALFTIWFISQPQNVVSNINDFTIYQVKYNGEDVTQRININELESIVSKYKCNRFPDTLNGYQSSQVTIEINGDDGGNPLHILLGEINVVYQSGNKGSYQIKDSKTLLNEILKNIY